MEEKAKRLKAYLAQVLKGEKIEIMCEIVDKVLLDEEIIIKK